nr:hypothetical protein [Legionella jordanis]
MALVSEVISEFQQGFGYLDENGRRMVPRYKFWDQPRLRKKLTDVILTKELESIAGILKKNMSDLHSQYGTEEFELLQNLFFELISQAMHEARIKRFARGKIETSNYTVNNHYILERSVIPVKPGLFESELINGLTAIKNKFPQYRDFINNTLQKMNETTLTPYTFFQDSMFKDGRGREHYSSSFQEYPAEDFYKLEIREMFAKQHLRRM